MASSLAINANRSGKSEKLPLPSRSYLHPRISPDGRRLAIEVEGSSHDVLVHDFTSGVLTNFTADGISHWPVWSPDGKRIGYRSGRWLAYCTNESGRPQVYVKRFPTGATIAIQTTRAEWPFRFALQRFISPRWTNVL